MENLLIIFTCFLATVNIVSSSLCAHTDVQCFTRGAQNTHSKISAGLQGVVRPSDPLFRDSISLKRPTIEYTLTSPKFSGLRYCDIELFTINPILKLFQYNMLCPNITMEGVIEIKGELGGLVLNGKGDCSVLARDYEILIQGKYKLNEESDGHRYIQLLDYNIEEVAKGRVKFNFENVFKNDVANGVALLKYLDENWKAADIALRKPVIDGFLTDYMDNINTYLKNVPADEVFPQ